MHPIVKLVHFYNIYCVALRASKPIGDFPPAFMSANYSKGTKGNYKLTLAVLFLALVWTCAAGTYSTTFTAGENPISEGSNWINGGALGLDWNNVRTIAGFAFGTESGNDPGSASYNDSTALLTGTWGSNQMAHATVKINGSDSGDYEEVELRLRSSLSAHSCTGYEIDYSVKPSNPYVVIVRWNGSLGDFTYLTPIDHTHYVQNGDVVKATVVGTTITLYINNVSILTIADGIYTSGNPGIGFYLSNNGGSGNNTNWGFSSFSATDLVASRPNPPRGLHVAN